MRTTRHLAKAGVSDRILVSQPPSESGKYGSVIAAYCASNPIFDRGGRRIEVECFRPDIDTTEGETTAATRIARDRGFESVLVITYWGHVSRVRIYFSQCHDGLRHRHAAASVAVTKRRPATRDRRLHQGVPHAGLLSCGAVRSCPSGPRPAARGSGLAASRLALATSGSVPSLASGYTVHSGLCALAVGQNRGIGRPPARAQRSLARTAVGRRDPGKLREGWFPLTCYYRS